MATDFLSRKEWVTTADPDSLEFQRLVIAAPRQMEEHGRPVRITLVIHARRVRAYGRRGVQPGAVSLFGANSQDRSGSGTLGMTPAYLERIIADHGGDIRSALAALASLKPGTSVADIISVEAHVFEAAK